MKQFAILTLLVLQTFWAGRPLNAQWRAGVFTVNMGQPISEVPWSKITHLVLCCAAGGPNGTVSQNWLTPSSYGEVLSTARANNVKVILTVGDYQGSWRANVSAGTVGAFASNVASYVNSNGFDGVDLDWESDIDVNQYIALVSQLRSALPGKIITMDTGDWSGLPNIAAATYSQVDQFNIMCYDMANGYGMSWFNDALLQGGSPSAHTCDVRVAAFTNLGVPTGKLGMGIPAFGYLFNGTTQPGTPNASFDGTAQWYGHIVTNPTWWNGGLNKRYDSVHKADYLSVAATNQFITYNDTDSIHDIVQWAQARGFGSYWIVYNWAEYIPGASGDGRFPLSAALYNELRGVSAPAITTPPISTPPVTIGPITVPPITVPPITIPPVSIPPVTLPPVQPAPSGGGGLAITTGSLVTGLLNSPYSAALVATGTGQVTWSVIAGGIPAGLMLNSSTGVISGVPGGYGTWSFTVQASSSAGTATRAFNLTIGY